MTSITNSTSSPLSANNFQLQKTPQTDAAGNNAAAGAPTQTGQTGAAGGSSKGGSIGTAGSGGSSAASASSGSSTTIKSETSVTNADGSVTTTITYADGSTSASTTPPDPTKANYAFKQQQKIDTGGLQSQTSGGTSNSPGSIGAADILV